jgi:hypothetical protein
MSIVGMFPNLSEDRKLVLEYLDLISKESDELLKELSFEDRLKVSMKFPFEMYELSNRLTLAMAPVGKAHDDALTRALERLYYIKNLHVEMKSKSTNVSGTTQQVSSPSNSEKGKIEISPALAMMMWNPSMFGLPKLGVPYSMPGGGIHNCSEQKYKNKYLKYKNKYLSSKKK